MYTPKCSLRDIFKSHRFRVVENLPEMSQRPPRVHSAFAKVTKSHKPLVQGHRLLLQLPLVLDPNNERGLGMPRYPPRLSLFLDGMETPRFQPRA